MIIQRLCVVGPFCIFVFCRRPKIQIPFGESKNMTRGEAQNPRICHKQVSTSDTVAPNIIRKMGEWSCVCL